MTRMIPAHPLVRAEWPHIVEVPVYDFSVDRVHMHAGVYVRRVSSPGWHVLAGLINHVVVTPTERGKGFGSQAVLSALRWLRAAGVPFALVHCTSASMAFYEQLGFELAPNFPAPNHNGPRVSMVATLSKRFWWPDEMIEYVEPW